MNAWFDEVQRTRSGVESEGTRVEKVFDESNTKIDALWGKKSEILRQFRSKG